MEETVQVQKKKTYSTSQLLGLIAGIILFIVIYYVLPIDGLSHEGRGVLATLGLMAAWWISEAINTGITGLVPLVLFPLTGAMAAGPTAAAYGSNTIFMFFGGFAISLALERWNLHNRIALTIINAVGTSINRLILGLMFAGGFLSMWVSNTATILMLLPIATAIASNIKELMELEEDYTEKDGIDFKKAAIFAVGFGSIIGGSTTIIGTPTNMILSGFVTELLGYELPFGNFMFFMLPFSILQYLLMYFLLTRVVFKIRIKHLKNANVVIKKQLKDLGAPSYEEKIVFAVFLATVFMWVSRSYLFTNFTSLSDTVISIVACILLYTLPNRERGSRILDGDSIKDMPWGVVLMLMGGMAIAAGFTNTDLAQFLGNQLLAFESVSLFGMISIVALFGLVMTQLAPNTASATILIPIAASLATSISVDPLYLMMAAALATGFATTLPSGTPVMGIMYGTGEFTIGELAKTGGILAIASEVLIVLFIYFLAPVMFGI